MEQAVTKSGFPPLPFEGPGANLRAPPGPQGQLGLCIPVSLTQWSDVTRRLPVAVALFQDHTGIAHIVTTNFEIVKIARGLEGAVLRC